MNTMYAGYGLWILALANATFFIVFAWSFYTPLTTRDWRSFGIFSAFVVALFAEMYGFPLTLYLLSGWLSSRFPEVNWQSHDAGHLLEMMFGWRSNPHFGPFHVVSFLLIVLGFWLLARAWPVLYIAHRCGELARTGPYARVRHPQYVGFALIMTGFLVQWPTFVTLVLYPVMLVTYLRLAINEERETLVRFGAEYRSNLAAVPRFLPRRRTVEVAP
jgi:protein-S-isoprenylcysteine O-methyltransferase Ste14